MKYFGLIGFPLSHSFSQPYFTEKFRALARPEYHYKTFELPDINDFPALLKSQPALIGLNVTIPHKQRILPFLDTLSPEAQRIGAVNTIAIHRDGTTTGHNTDYIGFRDSLTTFIEQPPNGLTALVLGTGGAAQAVRVALDDLKIPYRFVSRTGNRSIHNTPVMTYEEVTLQHPQLIINTTPLGMSPHVASRPALPYEQIEAKDFLFDLVYNPAETSFLAAGRQRGAAVQNGLPMLHGQAEAAWQIWQCVIEKS